MWGKDDRKQNTLAPLAQPKLIKPAASDCVNLTVKEKIKFVTISLHNIYPAENILYISCTEVYNVHLSDIGDFSIFLRCDLACPIYSLLNNFAFFFFSRNFLCFFLFVLLCDKLFYLFLRVVVLLFSLLFISDQTTST